MKIYSEIKDQMLAVIIYM